MFKSVHNLEHRLDGKLLSKKYNVLIDSPIKFEHMVSCPGGMQLFSKGQLYTFL